MSLTQQEIALSQIEYQRRGYQALSLTNFDNTSLPAIAAGGRVEIGDTLFYVGSNEAITGWAGIGNDTAAYIRIVPQGDGPPETALAEFTDTAPTWSDAKQGYYDATVAKRYIGGLYKDAGGNYTKKWLYHSIDKTVQIFKLYGDGTMGDLDISGSLTLSGASRVRVTKNNAQSIGTASATIIQYDDEVFDNLEEFASYRFTAKEAGYYIVCSSLLLTYPSSWSDHKAFEIRIYKNGANYSKGSSVVKQSTTGLDYKSEISDIVYLAATEYIDIRAYQDSGYTQTTSTDATSNYFSVHRLS